MGALSAFDMAIDYEFGGAGRQHEQGRMRCCEDLFNLGSELATAIDLEGPKGMHFSSVSRNSAAVVRLRAERLGRSGSISWPRRFS